MVCYSKTYPDRNSISMKQEGCSGSGNGTIIDIGQDITARKRMEADTPRRAESLHKLEAIATELTAQTIVADILETAVAGLANEFGDNIVRIYFNDKERRELVLRAEVRDASSNYQPGMR
jgi:hypothetical protein